jgi:two-component system LytT family sensor kinase
MDEFTKMNPTAQRHNWFIDFLVEDKYRLYRHVLIWVYLIFTEFQDASTQKQYSGNYDVYRNIIKMLLFLLAVYANMYVLVPKLLFNDRYLMYLFALVILISVVYLLPNGIFNFYFDRYRLPESERYSGIFTEIVPNVNLLGVAVFASTSIKLFQRWKVDSTRMTDLEKNSLEVELRELKNQISPHFLFNMLNNVNVLIRKDAETASAVVMKLSEFLRYQLYEAGGTAVSLASEIRFLNDFLELEKVRRDEFTFTVLNEIPLEMAELTLPPGLFLTFVENAVKHSADSDQPSSIHLLFRLNRNRLFFTCHNTKPEEPAFTKQGGLGLANIKRRLELLYAGKYTLAIQDSPQVYKVELSIPL